MFNVFVSHGHAAEGFLVGLPRASAVTFSFAHWVAGCLEPFRGFLLRISCVVGFVDVQEEEVFVSLLQPPHSFRFDAFRFIGVDIVSLTVLMASLSLSFVLVVSMPLGVSSRGSPMQAFLGFGISEVLLVVLVVLSFTYLFVFLEEVAPDVEYHSLCNDSYEGPVFSFLVLFPLDWVLLEATFGLVVSPMVAKDTCLGESSCNLCFFCFVEVDMARDPLDFEEVGILSVDSLHYYLP